MKLPRISSYQEIIIRYYWNEKSECYKQESKIFKVYKDDKGNKFVRYNGHKKYLETTSKGLLLTLNFHD